MEKPSITEYFGEVIYQYTSDQAVADGILFDIGQACKDWRENGLFSHITTNLLTKGYLEEDGSVRLVNVVDLLNQCLQLVKKATKNFTEPDYFFAGQVEFPDGMKRKIFIEQNECQKFTIMMPEDR